MTVLLTILGVLGRLLLLVLILVLLLILILLFVPIRYSVSGGGDREERVFHGEVTVSWLLRALTLRLHIEKPSGSEPLSKKTELLLFGINPKERKRAKRKARRTEAKNRRKRQLDELKDKDPAHYEELKAEAQARKEKRRQEELRREEAARRREEQERAKEEKLARKRQEAEAAAQRRKEAALHRIPLPVRLVQALFAAISGVFMACVRALTALATLPGRAAGLLGGLADRLFKAAAKAGAILHVLTDPRFRGALRFVKKHLVKLIRHIFPKNAAGDVSLGFNDPAQTGEVLGLLAAFYPRYAGRVELTPYFDRSILKGELSLKGRLYLAAVAATLLAALLNKDIQAMIHLYRNKKKEDTHDE